MSDLLRVLKVSVEAAGFADIDACDVANWLVSASILIPYIGGRIAFVHQSITEYLAAKELARRYQATPQILKEMLTPDDQGRVFRNFPEQETDYQGQPYIIDEFGGIKWIPTRELVYADNSWGYGQDPKTLDEFYTRLEGLVDVILSLEHISGYCYTQLTVEITQKRKVVKYIVY